MEEAEKKSLESWEGIDADFNLSRLEHLEGDAVSIQCVNSSEFVIGKQTNFNGPVTIINCANTFRSGTPKTEHEIDEDQKEEEEEKIVIRDQVLSKKAETVIQKIGEKSKNGKGCGKTKGSGKLVNGCQYLLGWLAKDFLKIPVGIWILVICLLACLVLILTLIYTKSEVKDGKKETLICADLIVRNDRKFCIYSEFAIVWKDSRTEIETKEPATYVIMLQTEGSFCYDHNYCVLVMESRSKGVLDEGSFPCNFLIGGEGNIYQDHGWELNIGSESFAFGEIAKSYIICFMGDFPTFPQVEATKALIEYGLAKGFIPKDFVVVASNATITDGTKDLGTIYRVRVRRNDEEKLRNDLPKASSKVSSIVLGYDFLPLQIFSVENTEINPGVSKERHPRIYTKADWNGSPPTSSVEMKLPVAYVIISHSGTSQCTSFRNCAEFIKNVQDFHMSDDYADIGYNFIVDPEGNIYEGRGWSIRNVIGGFVNNRNIDINVIGDYSKDLDPNPEQMVAVKCLIEYGVENGKISKNYSLIPANATYATLSPGKNVYKIIKNWPHFDSDPLSHVKDYDD